MVQARHSLQEGAGRAQDGYADDRGEHSERRAGGQQRHGRGFQGCADLGSSHKAGLRNHAGGGVQQVGEGGPAKWRLAAN
jgi:hypothetical protein